MCCTRHRETPQTDSGCAKGDGRPLSLPPHRSVGKRSRGYSEIRHRTFGKPGRPREDRLLRQREIYRAVAPLILTTGARRLTMREAARAACISVGGLYHYFPDKRSLVLHALQPEAFGRLCADFHAEYGHLERTQPAAYLEAFVDFQVRQVAFVRPALHAALELGADTFWHGMEESIAIGLDGFARTLARVVPAPADRDLRRLGRTLRRTLFAALLDRGMSGDELRDELRALIEGEPVAVREAAIRSA